MRAHTHPRRQGNSRRAGNDVLLHAPNPNLRLTPICAIDIGQPARAVLIRAADSCFTMRPILQRARQKMPPAISSSMALLCALLQGVACKP